MSGPIDVVGHAALDYLFEVEHIASPNESYPITSYEVLFGGGGANIAAAIAHLGGYSRLVAAVGDDFSTSGYEQHLNNLDVDLSLLYRIEGEESTKAFVYTDPNHNQSSYFYWGSSSKLPDIEAPALILSIWQPLRQVSMPGWLRNQSLFLLILARIWLLTQKSIWLRYWIIRIFSLPISMRSSV
ncbi:PfkB family carbohydrate kinase [Methanohalophilus profundi]|uniref:PfkB family carbohydrate kinase n=1 Tax=Methanohalophilus profundi TaxID=2138083 RepID=UPI002989F801|nr:PfkB family carbohydrate kinase [Methanohalophilus profundi]